MKVFLLHRCCLVQQTMSCYLFYRPCEQQARTLTCGGCQKLQAVWQVNLSGSLLDV